VRVVRGANAEANESIRAQIRDLEDRLATEWQTATADNIAQKQAETRRLTDEFTNRIVDGATEEE
jgi:ribosome recycling factor